MRALEEIVVVRQFTQLLGRRIDQLLAAVAGVDAPESRHAVEDPVAVRVEDVDALGARDDPRALLVQGLVIRERMQVVFPVEFLPVFAGTLFDCCHYRPPRPARRAAAIQTLNIRISRSYGVMISWNSRYSSSLSAVYSVTNSSPRMLRSASLPRIARIAG